MAEPETTRIALCQITSGPDPAANLELVADGVRRAAGEGASIVVFPEATMACFGIPLAGLAEPLDGPWASAVRGIADEHGVLVLAGMFTPADAGRVRNTLLITGRGEHLGYDKIHLYDAFGFTESRTVSPGEKPVGLRVGELCIGAAVCYDVRFPELFTALADQGVQAVLLGASWGAGPGKREQWETLVRARALDCTSWVLACGQADPAASGIEVTGTAPRGVGHSMVVDPLGRVVGALGAAPDMLVVDVDPAAVDEARRIVPVLANRRL